MSAFSIPSILKPHSFRTPSRFICITILLVLVASCGLAGSGRTDRKPLSASIDWAKQFDQGFQFRVWMNSQLVLGRAAFPAQNPPPLCGDEGIGCEYPLQSCLEHLFGAGPVIGGKIDGRAAFTTAFNGYNASSYLIPVRKGTLRQDIWRTSVNGKGDDAHHLGFYKHLMNRRFYDDDGDGKVDEDELDGLDNDHDWVRATDDVGADGIPDSLETGCKGKYDPIRNPDPAYDDYNPARYDSCHPKPKGGLVLMNDPNRYTEGNGIPDHGEPHVDEDYGAVSDQDVYIAVTDTFGYPVYTPRRPLGVKIVQKSYAWDEPDSNAVLPIEYQFINIGNKVITDAYVGFFADIDVGPVRDANYAKDDYVYRMDSLQTIAIGTVRRSTETPLGVTVIQNPPPGQHIHLNAWYLNDSYIIDPGSSDSLWYEYLKGNIARCVPCPVPPSSSTDPRALVSVGPVARFAPGDTVRLRIALVSGSCFDDCLGSLASNAAKALFSARRNFRPPVVPPAPRLTVTAGDYSAKLSWGPGNGGVNPMDIWDDSSGLGHIRDSIWGLHPILGHLSGGRIFEGYRIYRSNDPGRSPKSFFLLRQFDLPNDAFGYNVGIETTFVDSPLTFNRTYSYAVTSIGIPEDLTIAIPLAGGTSQSSSTILTDLRESPIGEAQIVTSGVLASDNSRQVLVVPNPYLGSEYYTDGHGFEGREIDWTPYKREIMFVRLPEKATIRVYSLAGDVIATIEHDDNIRKGQGKIPGQEEWLMFSESGRELASGIYLFSVDSKLGQQVGKFVVIK